MAEIRLTEISSGTCDYITKPLDDGIHDTRCSQTPALRISGQTHSITVCTLHARKVLDRVAQTISVDGPYYVREQGWADADRIDIKGETCECRTCQNEQ